MKRKTSKGVRDSVVENTVGYSPDQEWQKII